MKQLQEWKWLERLSPDMAGFSLVNEFLQCDTQYRIFTYQHRERQRSFSVLYDQATKEYLVRCVVGLTEYVDINFIVSELQGLEKVLEERLERTITQLARFDETTLCTAFREKQILPWAYGRTLPPTIAGFSLYIQPEEPFRALNGSYILIDYSDFAAESGLIVYYNIYRDEFFGELRVHRTPMMINTFDAKTVPELESKLHSSLEQTLTDLRIKISK